MMETPVPLATPVPLVPARRSIVAYGVPDDVLAELTVDAGISLQIYRARDAEQAVVMAVGQHTPILVDVTMGEEKLLKLTVAANSQTRPPVLITTGGPPFEAPRISRGLRAVAHVPAPLPAGYLCGMVDALRCGTEARRRNLANEFNRIQSLYDLTSNMLKVPSRELLGPVLERVLPRLFETSFILVSRPGSAQPIQFMHQKRPVPPSFCEALKTHLTRAWSILRTPNDASDWEWMDQIVVDAAATAPAPIKPESYVSAPIGGTEHARGFITIMPESVWEYDEARIQSFFVVGDLLGVVMQNFDLLDQLQERATHDGLTGLLNRQAMMDLVEDDCARSRRYNHCVSLVTLDLDHFKQINDTHGHQAGDEVLRRVSQIFRCCIRETDSVGRIGGEEFLLLLPQTDAFGARQLAERIRASVEAATVATPMGKVRVTISAGVASAMGESARVDELLARSDSALYDAKEQGRNRVIVDPHSLRVVADDRGIFDSLDLE